MTAVETREPVVTKPEPPRRFGSLVLGAILVGVGALWFLDALDVISIRAGVVLPAMLAVVGLALVVGSFDGEHSGLVVFGVFLTVAVVISAVAPVDAFRGGVGERQFRAESAADLAPDYRVGVGDLTLDFTDLELTESATVRASVGAGTLRVDLPEGLAVRIEARTGAGEVELFGEKTEGLSASRSYESPGFDPAQPGLTLDLDVGAGEIEVDR